MSPSVAIAYPSHPTLTDRPRVARVACGVSRPADAPPASDALGHSRPPAGDGRRAADVTGGIGTSLEPSECRLLGSVLCDSRTHLKPRARSQPNSLFIACMPTVSK